MIREILQIKGALEGLRPPNPHFMYADIGNRLALLADGDGALQVLERHLSESIDRILGDITILENEALELEKRLKIADRQHDIDRGIAERKEFDIKDKHYENLIKIKELIQRIDPLDMATEQSAGTQVYSLLNRLLAKFEPSKTNQEET